MSSPTTAAAASCCCTGTIDVLVGRVQRDGNPDPDRAVLEGQQGQGGTGAARGKQSHDKREAEKERDWNREKQRLLRRHNKDA